jgi:hypothetical protein
MKLSTHSQTRLSNVSLLADVVFLMPNDEKLTSADLSDRVRGSFVITINIDMQNVSMLPQKIYFPEACL